MQGLPLVGDLCRRTAGQSALCTSQAEATEGQFFLPGVITILDGLSEGQGIDPDPGFDQLLKVPHGNGGDKETTVAFANYQPFRGETIERLP
jgi:hypothetical protein